MGTNETDDALTPAVVEHLKGKIKRIESFKYSSNSFANHIKEVIKNVIIRLEDADACQDLELKKDYYTLSNNYIDMLDGQIETFRLAESSKIDSRCAILKYVALDAAKRLNLSSNPIPFFGDSFYCTGSFVYKKYYKLELAPFYQVASNISDASIFWPLIGHEIGHCKLSEMDMPENIKRGLYEHRLVDDRYIERIDEILADIVATRIYGLSFVASFATKFHLFRDSLDTDSYPRFHFRLSLMSEVLDDMDYPNILDHIANIDGDDAQREEIACLTTEILDMGQVIVPSITNYGQIARYGDDLSTVPKGGVDILYNVAWLSFFQGDNNLEGISKEVFNILKRWSTDSESMTEF